MRFAVALAAFALSIGLTACSPAPKQAETPPAKVPIDVSQLALKVDPYCGMSIEKHAPADTYTYKDKQYGFCSTFCKDAFAEDPEKWLANVGSGEMK